ncbi:arginine--tRNA ligase [Alkalihalobacillus sp. LMS39]|uniref:arginine--tRNA ligase n=1 Tax=Alkalihalobacillus sp. LMS39 TaxID=2924032 RepID=UPI001FB1FB96|nr:arginine--tRNA ligase [Alkalihalobacillus sp. LMS39]UOE95452.1 arginine--tRNA ligase [Alkalihalobacillus sp. LMS39]
MDYKKLFATYVYDACDNKIDEGVIFEAIERPKYDTMGDLAFPCFSLAKSLRKAPQQIAVDIANKITHPLFEKVEATGPYVNVFLHKKKVGETIVKKIIETKGTYGQLSIGEGKTVVIDFSSPNIAKPFSMGHLRSTVIGNALAQIYEKCGFNVVKINHLGDWGTQFGKLIAAYRLWGEETKVKERPIQELLSLYVRFHKEAEADETLVEEGRSWFKKLEEGNKEAQHLWTWFKEESLKVFMEIYELMGISFDSYHGEAFYNDKMNRALTILEDKRLVTESDGAKVVELIDENLPPCLLKKSDGATLYATRDVAAALYRQEAYQFDKALYVVGNEQSLHFKQLFLVLEKAGYSWAQGMTHVPFGMMLKDGKKMSTRKGKVVLLEQVIDDAIALAKSQMDVKSKGLENKEEVAKQVGVGAIMFHDLKNERMNDVEFSLEDMLQFEGETGPYVQYTHARACSLLRKGEYKPSEVDLKVEDDMWPILKELMKFSQVIERSYLHNEPSVVAKYVVDVAQIFNKYYATTKILENTEQKSTRLAVVYAVTVVLKEGLRLLGIQAPEKM